jgi:hypothetical protein
LGIIKPIPKKIKNKVINLFLKGFILIV